MGRKAIAAAGLLAVGAAFGSCGPKVPPHEVRIEYLRRELYPDRSINFIALSYFNMMNMNAVDGWDLSVSYLKPRPTSLSMIAGLDRDGTNDGTFDDLLVLEVTLKDKRGCELQRSDLPEGLRGRVDNEYERSTEAGYIALAQHRKVFRGALDKGDFEELLGLCSADDGAPAWYILGMIPNDVDVESDLLGVLEESE